MRTSKIMKVGVFVDYDNLLDAHKASGILDLCTKVLMRMPWDLKEARGNCDVRIYGGWYEGVDITPLAQELTVSLQQEFPAIIRLRRSATEITSLTTTAELAVSMMEEPGHHMFDTFRKKGRPGNIRIQKPDEIGCVDASCLLPLMKKLLKSGSCPVGGCSVGVKNLVYRNEQKVVDTMLSCDMIFAPKIDYDHIVLISGDDDFLPPIRTLMLRGVSVARCHPKPNRINSFVKNADKKLIEIEL